MAVWRIVLNVVWIDSVVGLPLIGVWLYRRRSIQKPNKGMYDDRYKLTIVAVPQVKDT